MSWSTTEFKALVSRAARGGGAPSWQAELFGAAAAQHLLGGAPLADLDTALSALPVGPILQIPPLLMAAQAQSEKGHPLSTDVPLSLLSSYAKSLPYALEIDVEALRITARTQVVRRPAIGRITVDDAFILRLRALAEKTFVPDSDASRAAGAGAGLVDND